MDCSRSGSSVRGISQARIREWVAISFSRGPSRPRGGSQSPALAGGFFTPEPPGKALSPSSPSVPRPCLRPDPLCSPLLFLLRTGPWGLGLQEGNRQCSASEEDSGGPGLFPEARRASPGRTLNAEQSGWGQRLLTEGSGTDGVESVIFHIQPK